MKNKIFKKTIILATFMTCLSYIPQIMAMKSLHLTVGIRNGVRIWDIKKNKLWKSIRLPIEEKTGDNDYSSPYENITKHIAFNPAHPNIFAYSCRGIVVICDLFKKKGNEIIKFAFLSRGQAAPLDPGSLKIFNFSKNMRLAFLPANNKAYKTLEIYDESKQPDSLSSYKIYAMKSNTALTFSPDGKQLAIGGTIVNWEKDTVIKQVAGAGQAVAFNSDGSTFAIAIGKNISVYDTKDWNQKFFIKWFEGRPQFVIFHPTDPNIFAYPALYSNSTAIRVYDIEKNKVIKKIFLRRSEHPVDQYGPYSLRAGIFTSDGKQLIAGVDGQSTRHFPPRANKICSWDTSTWKKIKTKELKKETDFFETYSLSLSSDNNFLSVVMSDERVKTSDYGKTQAGKARVNVLERKNLQPIWNRTFKYPVYTAKFMPDIHKKTFPWSQEDLKERKLFLLDMLKGEKIMIPKMFLPESYRPKRLLISRSSKSKVQFWDPANNGLVKTFPYSCRKAIALSPDGKKLAIIPLKYYKYVEEDYDLSEDEEEDEEEDELKFPETKTVLLEFPYKDYDYKSIGLEILDTKTLKVKKDLKDEAENYLHSFPRKCDAFLFSPHGNFLAAIYEGIEKDTIIIFDTKTWKIIKTSHVKKNQSILSFAFSPDEQYFAFGADDNLIRVFETKNWSFVRAPRAGDSIYSLTFITFLDGRKYLAAGLHDKIQVWDISSQDPKEWNIKTTLDSDTESLLFSLKNPTILVTREKGKAVIWDISNQDEKEWKPTITLPIDNISTLVFSSDGKILYCGLEDGTIQAWDTSSWKKISSFKAGTSAITSILLSP